MATTLTRPCPLCGVQNAAAFMRKNELRLVRCADCGMIYADPVPAEFASGVFYDAAGGEYLSTDKLAGDYADVRFARELRHFRRLCPRGSVLDVGCSSGGFLYQLTKRFPNDYQVLGADVSRAPLEHAKKMGVPVIEDNFLTHQFPEQFDAITFWAVMEHLFEPQKFYQKAVSILKPVKGLDARLYAGLESHCRQEYAGEVELVFGVSSLADEAVAQVARLKVEFPQVNIRLVECSLRLGANGKVSNLAQMLPHARPGSIAGLLSLLVDHGGEEDLYHVAEELLLEIDDLLPIIQAATLLGFATADEGDVKITSSGREFVGADISTRKSLFREAALTHVALLQKMKSALESRSDHVMPLEFFHDILDEHFTEPEVEKQIETALGWGRYAEIFSYDAESGNLRLHQANKPVGENIQDHG